MNTGSYVYLDSLRPSTNAVQSSLAAALSTEPPSVVAFADAHNCATYDRWPYGLQNRTGYYRVGVSDEKLKKQLAARPMTYLLGRHNIVGALGPLESAGRQLLSSGAAPSVYAVLLAVL